MMVYVAYFILSLFISGGIAKCFFEEERKEHDGKSAGFLYLWSFGHLYFFSVAFDNSLDILGINLGYLFLSWFLGFILGTVAVVVTDAEEEG